MTKLNIELNQYYRNRRSEVSCISGVVGADRGWDYESGMRFIDNIGRTYRPDGTYNHIPSEHFLDLVEHITDRKELASIVAKRMNDIYNSDRDYEICFADLPQKTQDLYVSLREQRKSLLQ